MEQYLTLAKGITATKYDLGSMSLGEKIPGMRQGRTGRNIVVGIGYLFTISVALMLFPITIGTIVGMNYRGIADRFATIPGIESGGGLKSGAVAGIIGFVLWGVIAAGGDTSENETGSDLAESPTENEPPSSESNSNDGGTDSSRSDNSNNPDSESSTETGSDNLGSESTVEPESTESEDESSAADADNSGSESTDDTETAEAETEPDDSNDESSPVTEADDSESDLSEETESDDRGETESSAEPDSSDADTDSPDETDSAAETESTVSVPSEVADGEARQATIIRVIDGDTMEVRFANGEEDTVRLIGVDTPETSLGNVAPGEYEGIPDTQAARDHLYNWGQQASQYATDELEGQEVRVVTDPEGDHRGSFGRLLAYLYVDEENFNLNLLEDGYARVYDSSFSLRGEFDSAESEARSNDIGLWNFEDESSSSESDANEDGSENEIDIPPVPADGDYDCGHFDTQEQAQYVLENTDGDPHRLDADGDGVACETLP